MQLFIKENILILKYKKKPEADGNQTDSRVADSLLSKTFRYKRRSQLTFKGENQADLKMTHSNVNSRIWGSAWQITIGIMCKNFIEANNFKHKGFEEYRVHEQFLIILLDDKVQPNQR